MSVLEAFLWWCWIAFLGVIFVIMATTIGIVIFPMILIALIAFIIV